MTDHESPDHKSAARIVRHAVACLNGAQQKIEAASRALHPHLTPEQRLEHQINLIADLATVNAALLVLTQTPLSASE